MRLLAYFAALALLAVSPARSELVTIVLLGVVDPLSARGSVFQASAPGRGIPTKFT